MICSKAGGYALQAVGRLAALEPGESVMVQSLCDDLGLPRYFVAKIFQKLVREGILISRKGRGGGFLLARPASRISVIELISVIDGQDHFSACPLGYSPCDDQRPCEYHDLWVPVRDRLTNQLDRMTLADLALADAGSKSAISGGLDGLRVMVLEDSFLVGASLRQMLCSMGCDVIGPIPSVDDALEMLDEHAIDGAVLDIEMGGVTSERVAARLRRDDRPFFFVTGYGNLDMLPQELRGYRRLSKPITEDALRSALEQEICVPSY